MAKTPERSDHAAQHAAQDAPGTPDAPRFALAWAMLVCAIAAILLAHPALSGGFLVNPRSDQYIAGYAFRDYAAEALRTSGSFPLWNPYLFGGMPYVDAMHGDIFYPTFLLRMFLPTDVAMTWGMILHVWLAGVAAYALFRAHRLSFAASLVGGLAYMMSGMVAGLVSPGHDGKIFISALLPLTMLMVRFGVRDGRRSAWGALALVVGLGVLTPHPQLLQYLLLCSGAYALWIAFGEGGAGAPTRAVAVQRLGLALGAILVGFAIGAVQFLPVSHYVGWSPRAGGAGWEHAISYSMPPEELVNTFLPEFSGILDSYWGRNIIHLHSEYLGVVVLILAAAAFGARDVVRRRATWFWTGMLVVTGVWALGGYTPFYHLVYAIVPGTKFFRAPSTIMLMSAFAVSALAALGTARVLAAETGKRYLAGVAIGIGVLTLLGASGMLSSMFSSVVDEAGRASFDANASAVTLGAFRMFAFGAITLVVISAIVNGKISAKVAPFILGALVVCDLWSVERQYWQFSRPAAELYATDPAIERIKSDSIPGRVLALQLGPDATPRDPFLNGDALMVNGVRSILGYHGNELGRYQQIYGKQNGLQGLINPTFWEANNLRWIYTNVAELPSAFPAFEKVLGPVRNAAGSNIYLFKSRDANPPAWVATAIMKRADDVTLGAYMGGALPLRAIALFDTSAAVAAEELTAAPTASAMRATVTKWAPGAIDIQLDGPATDKSALVVSENYYPGWTATIDGKTATVGRADYTLIGVPLSAGAKHIELRFVSDAYVRGKGITLAALAVSLILILGGFTLDLKRVRA